MADARGVDIDLRSLNINLPVSKAEIEEYANRMIQVLDRGHFIDKFEIADADANIHYEWHKADDPMVHARLSRKGFKPDDELARTSGFINTDGAGNPRILDTRCYSIPKWKKAILDKIETENAARAADPNRGNSDFLGNIVNEGLESIGTEGISTSRKVGGEELAATLSLKLKE